MKISIEQYGDQFSANLKSKVEYIDNTEIDNTTSEEALGAFIKLMELAGFNMKDLENKWE